MAKVTCRSSGRREVQLALPGMSHLCDTPERTAGTLLRTSATVFSRWFVAMRAASDREKARRQAFREEHGFKKKAKVPPQPLVLTAEERMVAEYSESVVRAMYGDEVADYARDRFRAAISTGDMRSFKIRLLMIKARDSLQGPLHDEVKVWTDAYIEAAEKAAGCVPCPGPRRLSRAEQEKKRRREAACSYYEEPWFSEHDREDASANDAESAIKKVHKDRKDRKDQNKKKSTGNHNIVDNSVGSSVRSNSTDNCSTPIYGNFAGELPDLPRLVASISQVLGDKNLEDLASEINDEEDYSFNNDVISEDTVTVTPPTDGDTVTVTVSVTPPVHEYNANGQRFRKKEFGSVSEILEEYRSGRMKPYASAEVIVADMRRGCILPHEAMMFMSAMEKMNSKTKTKSKESRKAEDFQSMYEGDDTDGEDVDGEEELMEGIHEDYGSNYGTGYNADEEW